ncbi:MAG: DUF2100 domain-containing protein [Methanomicrobiales archaeon]
MDNLRMEQCRNLIKNANKFKENKEVFKPATSSDIDLKIFEEVLYGIIDAEEFIYASNPLHNLNEKEAQEFCNKIISIRDNLDSLLSDFGVISGKNVEDDIELLSKNYIFLTTKNSFKKMFNNLGVDVQRIIVVGVPLEIEDMKIINPKIHDNALKPIKKKIEHVKNDIERKIEKYNPNNIIMISEADKAGEVLGKRVKKLYKADIFLVNNLKDINALEFKSILDNVN